MSMPNRVAEIPPTPPGEAGLRLLNRPTLGDVVRTGRELPAAARSDPEKITWR